MDLSWSELLIVGIVAVIVIGKDLPGMFREFGRFSAKIRAMGREFSRAMEAAAKESGVKDVADDLKKISNPKSMGLDAVRSAADRFEKWDPLKPQTATPATAPVTALGPGSASTPAAAPMGPATAALAQSVAAKKAASAETVAKLREAKAPAANAAKPAPTAKAAKPAPATKAAKPTPAAKAAKPDAAGEPAVKRGGRVRKKAEPGDDA